MTIPPLDRASLAVLVVVPGLCALAGAAILLAAFGALVARLVFGAGA